MVLYFFLDWDKTGSFVIGQEFNLKKILTQTSAADPGISELGARSRALEFLGSGDSIDVPTHIPYACLRRFEKEVHIVKIAFL